MADQSIAVIGSGIAGLAAAWLLHPRTRVTVFESETRIGGHSNTVQVDDEAGPLGVDTGFIVFNPVNYPNLTALFERLHVPTLESQMSFAVSIDGGALEYSGSSVAGLFGQPRNLIRARFYAMLADIARFNRAARRLARDDGDPGLSLAAFLDGLGLGRAVREHYLLPMAAAIWSCPVRAMLEFPALTLARFFDNHGLLNINDRPVWRTVAGGSRRYVERMSAPFADRILRGEPVRAVTPVPGGVTVTRANGTSSRFDQVIIATHADQALAMLAAPSGPQRSLLSKFRYQSNLAVLHRDPSSMPRRRRVWSAWNYLARGDAHASGRVSVTYWMNALQRLETRNDYFVSLNPLSPPRDEHVITRFEYMHPVFDVEACRAQSQLATLQGRDRIWFCGSYFGHGFHEDALNSALDVCVRLGATPPWWRGGRPTGRSGDTAPPRAQAPGSLERAARVAAGPA